MGWQLWVDLSSLRWLTEQIMKQGRRARKSEKVQQWRRRTLLSSLKLPSAVSAYPPRAFLSSVASYTGGFCHDINAGAFRLCWHQWWSCRGTIRAANLKVHDEKVFSHHAKVGLPLADCVSCEWQKTNKTKTKVNIIVCSNKHFWKVSINKLHNLNWVSLQSLHVTKHVLDGTYNKTVNSTRIQQQIIWCLCYGSPLQ